MGGLFKYDSPVMEGIGIIVDLIWLNILTILCCIPIVTIGASVTALYTVTMKMLKDEDTNITKLYLDAFKNNLKKATIEWIIILLFIGIICGDLYIINRNTDKMFIIIKYGLLVFSLVIFLIYTYIFPLQAYFENTIKMHFKNALILSISNIYFTIVIVFVQVFPMVLVSKNKLFLLFEILMGFAGTAYINSFFFQKVFDKIKKSSEKGNSNSK